jgi:hypothetical protein
MPCSRFQVVVELHDDEAAVGLLDVDAVETPVDRAGRAPQSLAHGPCQALATTGTAEWALNLCDEQRREITNAVTMRNRKFGPAMVMELAE